MKILNLCNPLRHRKMKSRKWSRRRNKAWRRIECDRYKKFLRVFGGVYGKFGNHSDQQPLAEAFEAFMELPHDYIYNVKAV